MQINTLKLKKKKKRKTIGRGGKKGTYSGKGNKGQKARSGVSIDPLFEGGRSTLIDHMKKKRGFTSRKQKPVALNFSKISKKFKKGDIISVTTLIEKKILKKVDATKKIKVVGLDKTRNDFTFEKNILLTKSAKKA